jgi:hypothetical protein
MWPRDPNGGKAVLAGPRESDMAWTVEMQSVQVLLVGKFVSAGPPHW